MFDWFSDSLAPASGTVKYDPSVFEGYDAGQAPDGWSLTTQQAIDNYATMYPATFDVSSLTQSPIFDPANYDAYDFQDVIGEPTGALPDFGAYTPPEPVFQEPSAPYINLPNLTTAPNTPASANSDSSDWVGSIVTGVTALAAAAMKLIPTIQALRNGDVIKSGSMTNAGTVTANNNGTITTRNTSTGQVSTTIPAVGKAYQTPDGNIITNNGNGTYTVVKPDGTRYTGNYTSTSTTGGLTVGAGTGFFSNPQNVMLAGGAALLAVLLLKGK